MAGTFHGGKRAAATNRELHGQNFYARIGSLGGSKPRIRWFALHPELASIAGRKGGRISKRSAKV